MCHLGVTLCRHSVTLRLHIVVRSPAIGWGESLEAKPKLRPAFRMASQVEPEMPDLNLVLRLVSSERIVPDALLEAEARISELQFLNARLVQSVMELEAMILRLKGDRNRLAARASQWDYLDYEGGWSP